MNRLSAKAAVLGIGVLGVGFWVRLLGARGIDLGLDGGLSVALAVLPLPAALDFLSHDVHPPLAYLVLRGWIWLVGTSPFAIKFGSVIAGVLTVAVTMAWSRRLAGSWGIVAGLVVALAPAAVEISDGPREYALALLSIVLAATAYARWNKGGSRWFVIWGTLAIWSSYLAVGVLAAAGIDAIVRPSRRRRLPVIIAVGATIFPWLAFIFAHGFARTLGSAGPRQNGSSTDPPGTQVRDLARVLSGGLSLQPEWLGPALFALAVAVLLVTTARPGAVRRGRRFVLENDGLFLGLTFAASAALALAANTFWTRNTLPTRYALPAIVPFAIVFAAGTARAKPIAGVLAAGLVASALLGGTVAWLQRPLLPPSFWDPVAVTAYLDENADPGDVVVFISPEQAGYYQALSKHPRPWTLIPAGTDYLQGDAAARSRATLSPLVNQVGTFWLVLYRPSLGEGATKVADWLSLNTFPETDVNLPDSQIEPFVARHADNRATTVNARFQGGVDLAGATLAKSAAPGSGFPLELDWRPQRPLQRNLKVFVHLVDVRGKLWSQHDSPPVNGRDPTNLWTAGGLVVDRHALSLPSNLPEGQYWIEVGLYDDAGRLALKSGGDTIRLGPVTISGKTPAT